ncbi:MAG TPA: hypothetical protein VM821_00310 [Abditibacteriaceae bacterium]|nr:hypothetical protein [Abditibacteriaceae bacterium]
MKRLPRLIHPGTQRSTRRHIEYSIALLMLLCNRAKTHCQPRKPPI